MAIDSAANGLAKPTRVGERRRQRQRGECGKPTRDRTEPPVSRGAPSERGRRSGPPTTKRGRICRARIWMSDATGEAPQDQ
jgi:hypothetical protein